MTGLLSLPLLLQGFVMFVDEFYFHWRRGLGEWERVGHVLDTLSLALPIGLTTFSSWSQGRGVLFMALAIFSCLFVTKDEWVHAREAEPGEHWVHALLFVLHPLVLGAAFLLWRSGVFAARMALFAELAALIVWMTYQYAWWSRASRHERRN